MKEIRKATLAVLSNRKTLGLFCLLSLSLFMIMFLIPVYSIPGNDIQFQSALFHPKDYLLLTSLALLSSLVVTIQIQTFIQKFETNKKAFAISGISVVSGVFSSIFASATCAMCVGALFSFLGFSTLLSLVQSRWYILVGAMVFLLLSLYLSSRNYNRGCELCVIES